MNEVQGQVLTPTGCHLAEQTPLDQCFESVHGQVAGSAARPDTLPKVGGDINIVLPFVLTLSVVILYMLVKKVLTK